MKTYFLEHVCSADAAVAALRDALPGQESPWLLCAGNGDAIAYFNVDADSVDVAGPAVVADISGRHFNEDEKVLAVLKSLQSRIGGILGNDV